MSREEMLDLLSDLIELEDEDEELTEDYVLEELDSITKLGVLALLDTYAPRKVTVQELINCKTVKEIIDLVQ